MVREVGGTLWLHVHALSVFLFPLRLVWECGAERKECWDVIGIKVDQEGGGGGMF